MIGALDLDGAPRVVAVLALVVVVARLAGTAARRLGQPAVMGEILGGIALGPSLLGAVAPGAVRALFPTEVTSGLRVLAHLVAAVSTAATVTAVAAAVAGASVVVVALVGLVRPALRRTGVNLAGALVLAISASTATELLGVHAVFGAFVAGAVLPRDADVVRRLHAALDPLTTTALLPAFFVGVGLSTDVGSVDRAWMWGVVLAVVAVAVAGKFLGAVIASRWVGLDWVEAWTMGALLNTRGLTEIVILSVGLELGAIDRRLFTVMVVMALVTTLMATPVLSVLERRFGPIGTAPLSSHGPSGREP